MTFFQNDIRTKLLTFFCFLYCEFWTDFTHCSSVSIISFDYVNGGWDCLLWNSCYPGSFIVALKTIINKIGNEVVSKNHNRKDFTLSFYKLNECSNYLHLITHLLMRNYSLQNLLETMHIWRPWKLFNFQDPFCSVWFWLVVNLANLQTYKINPLFVISAIIFDINLNFLIKPFFFMTKKSRQSFKYLKNEKSFQGDVKSIFHHFKRLLVAKNCLRSESAPLRSGLKNLIAKKKYALNIYHTELLLWETHSVFDSKSPFKPDFGVLHLNNNEQDALKICVKEKRSGNKIIPQIFKIMLRSVLMLKNSSTCNFPCAFLTYVNFIKQ